MNSDSQPLPSFQTQKKERHYFTIRIFERQIINKTLKSFEYKNLNFINLLCLMKMKSNGIRKKFGNHFGILRKHQVVFVCSYPSESINATQPTFGMPNLAI